MIDGAGRFEALEHRLDERVFTVPLLIDENRNPFHRYTATLLRAAEIIAPQVRGSSENLHELETQVGQVLEPDTEAGKEGLVIEGDGGHGAVTVWPEVVRVVVRDRAQETVPTALFRDMLQAWGRLAVD